MGKDALWLGRCEYLIEFAPKKAVMFGQLQKDVKELWKSAANILN
jgi:hypothetical protein